MKVFFEEKEHKYFNEDKVKYLSVSGLAHKLEEYKDWRQQADWSVSKYNRENGTNWTGQELFDFWEFKKTKSSEAGTIFHSIEEESLLNCPHPIFYGKVCSIKTCSFIGDLKVSIPIEELDDNTVYPELLIYNHTLRVAGQSDKIIIVNNTLHCYDFKTDQEIKYEGYQGQTLIAPVSHLQACNFDMYSLKMSLYMHLIHKKNPDLKLGDLVLEHVELKRDKQGIPILENGVPITLKKTNIKVPYREKEVIDICKAYLKGKL